MSSALQSYDLQFEPQILAAPILIVEDNEISRVFLEKTLKGAGFSNIQSVTGAQQALQYLTNHQPELIILDIIMSGMDGFSCCDAIRKLKNCRNLPILMQTVITEPALRVKAFSLGATDFISKPVFPAELCARVRVHLERGLSIKSLEQYKERIESELCAARELQRSILPQSRDIDSIRRNGKLDVSAFFQPSSEIGGDCWGTKPLRPNQQALWLADFSGHGVASALNTFRLQAYLKEYSTMMDRPGEYLSYLNDKLRNLLLRGQFATMFYGIIDTSANDLSYACAASPHPLLRRARTGKVDIIDGSSNPLGIGMQIYPNQHTTFEQDDVLWLYSDALTETEDKSGRYIEEGEMAQWLAERPDGSSAEEIKEYLFKRFSERIGGPILDDFTMVIIARLHKS